MRKGIKTYAAIPGRCCALALPLLLLLLGGCSYRELPDLPGDAYAVHFSTPGMLGATTGQADTRALIPENMAAGTTVRVLAYKRLGAGPDITVDTYAGENTYVVDAAGELSPCVTDADGVLTAGTPGELYLREDTYDFYAVTPALAVDRASGTVVRVPHRTDYATGRTEAVVVQKPATLGTDKQVVTLSTLERRCARVSFAVTRKFGNVTRVQVQQVQLTRMADAPLQGVPAGDLAPAANGTTLTLTAAEFTPGANPWEASAGVNVLPKTEEAYALEMQVRFNEETDVTELTAPVGAMMFQKGYHYAFNLVLKGNTIGLTLTVAPWGETSWNDDTGQHQQTEFLVATWVVTDWSDNAGGFVFNNMSYAEWTALSWSDDAGN